MTQIRWIVALLASTSLVAGCRSSSRAIPTPVEVTTPARPAAASPAPGRAVAVLKCGLDPDAATIHMAAKPITVAELSTLSLPADIAGNLEDYQNHRVGEFERQVWRVRATIKSIQLRQDGDYFVEIEGTDGAKSVVEVPDPGPCKGSALEPLIASARRALSEHYHPTAAKQELDEPATFEGVGFWGFRGRPTGVRLMPGLSVSFVGT